MQHRASSPLLVSGSSSSKQTTARSHATEVEQQQLSQQPATHPAAATYRALPLLSSDLPHTIVTVTHSSVRPDYLGKEVPSFIVFVNPGNGKNGWKVEKMNLDVLRLDQRMRSSVSKEIAKQIGILPLGNLWNTNAPLKVDQRKVVLETYLQTLIRLPVEHNEVIAFFTSDILREQQIPAMKAGYKEGYLTKRGKKLGGWKTRYFVLQGPILEYYGSRDGAHFGSIHITRAQIGRQQMKEKPDTNDDENEYRHAFLIVEDKKDTRGNHLRHVLCAESDEETDSWVEMLVRYSSGKYNAEYALKASSSVAPTHNSSSAEGLKNIFALTDFTNAAMLLSSDRLYTSGDKQPHDNPQASSPNEQSSSSTATDWPTPHALTDDKVEAKNPVEPDPPIHQAKQIGPNEPSHLTTTASTSTISEPIKPQEPQADTSYNERSPHSLTEVPINQVVAKHEDETNHPGHPNAPDNQDDAHLVTPVDSGSLNGERKLKLSVLPLEFVDQPDLQVFEGEVVDIDCARGRPCYYTPPSGEQGKAQQTSIHVAPSYQSGLHSIDSQSHDGSWSKTTGHQSKSYRISGWAKYLLCQSHDVEITIEKNPVPSCSHC